MRVSKPAQARHDAATLPRIRDLEADGLSLRQIADQLQQDGIPSPGGVGKWSHIAVKRILERAEQTPAPPPFRPDCERKRGGKYDWYGNYHRVWGKDRPRCAGEYQHPRRRDPRPPERIPYQASRTLYPAR